MRSRVYEMIEGPSVCLSVTSIDSGIPHACCWAQCSEGISIDCGGCRHSTAMALQHCVQQQMRAVHVDSQGVRLSADLFNMWRWRKVSVLPVARTCNVRSHYRCISTQVTHCWSSAETPFTWRELTANCAQRNTRALNCCVQNKIWLLKNFSVEYCAWHYYSSYICCCLQCFGAVGLASGREHPACKNWVMGCWCGYLSGARCRLFAYGRADATASQNPSCLASFKSRLVLSFWYRLTQVVLMLNGCNSSSSSWCCECQVVLAIILFVFSVRHSECIRLLLCHVSCGCGSLWLYSVYANCHTLLYWVWLTSYLTICHSFSNLALVNYYLPLYLYVTLKSAVAPCWIYCSNFLVPVITVIIIIMLC